MQYIKTIDNQIKTKMAKIPQKPRELAPAGTHAAKCFAVVDLGTQTSTYKGEEKENRQILLGFDLVDEKTKEGKNVCVFPRYTYSSGTKAKLTEIIKSWFNKKASDFDMAHALHADAMVTVTHSEDGKYANVTAITAPPKNLKVKKSTEPSYSLFLDEFDPSEFNELPEWVQGKVADSPEYLEASAPKKKTTPAKKAKK